MTKGLKRTINGESVSIGKKISGGFIMVIAALLVLGGVAYHGISDVAGEAEKRIWGNRVMGDLIQHEMDQLRKINRLSAAVLQENSSEILNATGTRKEDNEKSCIIGYETRMMITDRIPSATPLFERLDSACESISTAVSKIDDTFLPSHPELVSKIEKLRDRHELFISEVGRTIEEKGGRLDNYQDILKNAVRQAICILRACENDPSIGYDKDRREIATSIVKHLRYGNEGKDYCWILDTKANMVMHPYHPELYDQDLSQYQDEKGGRPFAKMVEIAKERQKGFLFYNWPAYDDYGTGKPKLSYVEYFDPWYWIVGSGIYLEGEDDVFIDSVSAFVEGKDDLPKILEEFSLDELQAVWKDPEISEIAATLPELNILIESAEKAHRNFIESVKLVGKLIAQMQIDEARKEFRGVLDNRSLDFEASLRDILDYEMNLSDAAAGSKMIFEREVIPASDTIVGTLREIRILCDQNVSSAGNVLESAILSKRLIGVVMIVTVLFAAMIAVFVIRTNISVLEGIATALGTMVSHMRHSSTAVYDVSIRVAEGNASQMSSVEEAASAVEELASMTKRNRENADHANNFMKETVSVTDGALTAVNDLITSMQKIETSNSETHEIVAAINSIALETNLLSLNASVEAARAGGEVGSGFAVIAKEVRNLAIRSSEAAKRTNKLIEEATARVRDGSETLVRTEHFFKDVKERAETVGKLVEEITAASKEQSLGLETILKMVSLLDSIQQDTMRNVETFTQASGHMRSEAERMVLFNKKLKRLIGMNGHANKNGNVPLKVEGVHLIEMKDHQELRRLT